MERNIELKSLKRILAEIEPKDVNHTKREEEKSEELVFPPLETCFPRGFSVEEKELDFPGCVYLELRLTESSFYVRKLRCPECGSDNIKSRGTQKRSIKDIPFWGREVLWDLILPEFSCLDCGRNSFVADVPEVVRRGSGTMIRLEEFIVFLAARTSCEGASRILSYMDTSVSGDTVLRLVRSYEENTDDDVWRRAHQFREKPIRRITENQAENIADSLAYYMETEILSLEKEKRIREMERLFDLVFTQKKVSPGCSDMTKSRRKRLPVFRWKNDER